MEYWGHHRHVMGRGSNWWESVKIGGGAAPIETTEGLSLIHIFPLDVRLTPSRNVQKYYTEYRNAANAEAVLRRRITECEDEITYIESVEEAVSYTHLSFSGSAFSRRGST